MSIAGEYCWVNRNVGLAGLEEVQVTKFNKNLTFSVIKLNNWNTVLFSPLSVHYKVPDGCGQAESLRPAPFQPRHAYAPPHGPAAPVGEGGGPRLPAHPVLERHLAVAPHRGHDRVEGLPAETGVRNPEVATVDQEGQGTQLHIQHHQEGVRDREHFLLAGGGGGREGRVCRGRGVVERLVSSEVPAPGGLVAANQTLVTSCNTGEVKLGGAIIRN